MANGTDIPPEATGPPAPDPGVPPEATGPPSPALNIPPEATGPPSPTASTTSSDPSLFSDLSTLGKSALQFVGSPAGGQILTGALGMQAAGAANRQVAGLYKPIQATGAQFTGLGTGIQGQLTGGPAVKGPMGGFITGSTGFAQQQQGVAQTYGTGNLTPTQQQQVNAFVQQQKSMAMAELANAGINDPNSSQMQSKMQEINNNALYMAQNMVAKNQEIATGAQNAVQSVYNTILEQALKSAGLGTDAQLAAAQGIIKGDQQIGTSLQTLLKGISGMLTTAQPQQPTGQAGGGVAQQQTGGGANVAQTAWGAVKDIGSKLGIGGSSTDLSTAYSPNAPQMQLPTANLSMPAGSLVQPGATDTGAVMQQPPASLDAYAGASAPTLSGFDLGLATTGSASFDTAPGVDMTQG